MAARKLGGGRILGSGRGLAPPAPGTHNRSSSLLSMTESVRSVESGVSTPLGTSPLPDRTEMLGERVSVENRGGGGEVTAASTRLVCPICNEEMMTLLQLNRHLDDDHRELAEVEQDEVKNWFEKQVVKAKKFQPLVVINQKLKGLDVFESNDVLAALPIQSTIAPNQPARAVEPVRQPDPDEVVTRAHWQKHGYNDVCTEPSCGKRLGSVNGNINCRKCGRLFCEDHTMYQIKLSRSAQHEPVRGFWCRCCETCYKSREGYNDHNGLIRNHTDAFLALRRQRVDKHYLEISRLEKRLSKLTQLLANLPEDLVVSSGGGLLSGGRNDPRKTLEQAVVTWEEDAKVAKCPFCQQEFGSWTFRRHHCRICGRVVCADPRTACSTEVGLNVATKNPPGSVSLDIRMCRDCKTTIFSKKDFEAELSHKPQVQRSYENLLQFERGIRPLLASFQRTLPMLQDPDRPPSHTQLAEASKVRKRLIDSFGKYDLAAKRIRDLPTTSDTQIKLQKAIYQQASNFLHLHMLPLKALPKMLKHASPHGASTAAASSRNGGALAAIKYSDMDSASQMSSSSSVLAMEAEEKELRERLIVLEEQKFLVSEMISDANKRRKFDEVSSLAMNMEDLSKEIDQITSMIEHLDFAGAYESGQVGR